MREYPGPYGVDSGCHDQHDIDRESDARAVRIHEFVMYTCAHVDVTCKSSLQLPVVNYPTGLISCKLTLFIVHTE
jgi:hypothetical protein